MRRSLISVSILLVLACTPPHLRCEDVQQYLRDEYVGKTLIVRGFYLDDELDFDSAGSPVGRRIPGDWTIAGLVRVSEIDLKDSHLMIKARRVTVISDGRVLQVRLAEDVATRRDQDKDIFVKIRASIANDNPSAEQVVLMMGKIFLTGQDRLGALVPQYWKPCVSGGPGGRPTCRFSDELLQVPGFSNRDSESSVENLEPLRNPPRVFHRGDGVTPPKLIHHRDPEYNERGRKEKCQGSLTIQFIVGEDGLATDIHVLKPLGCGLDAQAVAAVQQWKFKPAEKDRQPVPVQIETEEDFHLY